MKKFFLFFFSFLILLSTSCGDSQGCKTPLLYEINPLGNIVEAFEGIYQRCKRISNLVNELIGIANRLVDEAENLKNLIPKANQLKDITKVAKIYIDDDVNRAVTSAQKPLQELKKTRIEVNLLLLSKEKLDALTHALIDETQAKSSLAAVQRVYVQEVVNAIKEVDDRAGQIMESLGRVDELIEQEKIRKKVERVFEHVPFLTLEGGKLVMQATKVLLSSIKEIDTRINKPKHEVFELGVEAESLAKETETLFSEVK